MITFKELMTEGSLEKLQVKLAFQKMLKGFSKEEAAKIAEWYLSGLDEDGPDSDVPHWEKLEQFFDDRIGSFAPYEYAPIFFDLLTMDLRNEFEIDVRGLFRK